MSTYTGSFDVPSGDYLTVESGGTISVPSASIAGAALTNASVVGSQLAPKAVASQTSWSNVIDYGADPTGASDSSTAFADAQTAAGSGWVFVPKGAYQIASSPTYTAPFLFAAGAIVEPTAGNTVSFSNSVEAPLTQIFGGSGSVRFSYGTTVYPEWWGALGNVGSVTPTAIANANDDGPAIRAAIGALSVVGGVVQFQPRATLQQLCWIRDT